MSPAPVGGSPSGVGPSPMKKIGLVLLGAVVAGAVVGILSALADDREGPSGPATTTTTAAPVSAAGNDLISRLDKGRGLGLHVRYEPPADTVTEGTGAVSVELWRSGGRVRQDLVLLASGQRTEVRAFDLDDGNVLCQRPAEGAWRCVRTRSVATEEGRPASLIDAAVAGLAGAQVTTSKDSILGSAVTCYAIAGGTGPGKLCVTADGVPLRLAVGGQELTATVVERQVVADVFDLPAELDEKLDEA